MPTLNLSEAATLPADRFAGALAARVWRPDVDGPSVVAVRENGVFDVSAAFPTMRDLCEAPSPAEALRAAEGPRIGALSDILAHTPRDSRVSGRSASARAHRPPGDQGGRRHLRPIAARAGDRRARARQPRRRGEGARGDRARAGRRSERSQAGLARGDAAEGALVEAGAWSQYLEVGIGPDAEVFTKSQPMSARRNRRRRRFPQRLALEQPRTRDRARGRLDRRDRRRDARQRRQPARFRGALGASARQGEGPERELRDRPLPALVRRDLHARRRAPRDGLARWSRARTASVSKAARRWPRSAAIRAILPRQTIGATHAYPDGFVLLLGTMFAPVADRGAPGMGFTHRSGDIVTIGAEKLGQPRQSHAPMRRVRALDLRRRRLDAQSRQAGLDLSASAPKSG